MENIKEEIKTINNSELILQSERDLAEFKKAFFSDLAKLSAHTYNSQLYNLVAKCVGDRQLTTEVLVWLLLFVARSEESWGSNYRYEKEHNIFYNQK